MPVTCNIQTTATTVVSHCTALPVKMWQSTAMTLFIECLTYGWAECKALQSNGKCMDLGVSVIKFCSGQGQCMCQF